MKQHWKVPFLTKRNWGLLWIIGFLIRIQLAHPVHTLAAFECVAVLPKSVTAFLGVYLYWNTDFLKLQHILSWHVNAWLHCNHEEAFQPIYIEHVFSRLTYQSKWAANNSVTCLAFIKCMQQYYLRKYQVLTSEDLVIPGWTNQTR